MKSITVLILSFLVYPMSVFASNFYTDIDESLFVSLHENNLEYIRNKFSLLNEGSRKSPFNLITYAIAINSDGSKPSSEYLKDDSLKFVNGYISLLRGNPIKAKSVFRELIKSNIKQSVFCGTIGLLESSIYCSNMSELEMIINNALKSKLALSSVQFRRIILAYKLFHKSKIANFSNFDFKPNEFNSLNKMIQVMICDAMIRYYIWTNDLEHSLQYAEKCLKDIGDIAELIIQKAYIIELLQGYEKAQRYLKSKLDHKKQNQVINLQILINKLPYQSEGMAISTVRQIVNASKDFNNDALTTLEIINLLLDYRIEPEFGTELQGFLSKARYVDEFLLFNIISAKMALMSNNDFQLSKSLSLTIKKFEKSPTLLWLQYDISFYEDNYEQSNHILSELLKHDPSNTQTLFQKYLLCKKNNISEELPGIANAIVSSGRFVDNVILTEIKPLP